jgi:predicted nucleotidyltransferase component of viral defense system
LSFVHDDPEFDDLLRIVAEGRGLAVGLVEKDYWVTHVLWSLHELRLEVWFKGGTSLSKGFGLIERFSEDLDLKLEPGSAARTSRSSSRSSTSAA